MDQEEARCCPFCGYKANGDYQIMLHLETFHPENGESPFIVKDDASSAALVAWDDDDRNEEYVNCPMEGCGEALLPTELESHIEMHKEEQDTGDDDSHRASKKIKVEPKIEAAFDTKLSSSLRNLDDGDNQRAASDKQTTAKAVWRALLKMPDASSKLTSPSSKTRRRLGKSELGPHAHEKQMPPWLVKLLLEEDGAQEEDGALKATNQIDSDGKLRKTKICPNMQAGVIPVLEQLLNQDVYTEYAYLCDPAVRHVSKLRKEGGFCGYRNIQMLTSYILGVESQGYENFNTKIPTIFQIQDYIEHAWDLGINATGRIETGGIRGTRKYIGTPDAQAMFYSLNIACDAQGIKPKKESSNKTAPKLLFSAVESYFNDGCTDFNPKVRGTSLPPIYFQHPGHSMTIVGFEKQTDGTRNLIVFDPMFHDASNIIKLIGRTFVHKDPEDLLKAYRRGNKYLKKYNEFELLKLTPPPKLRNGDLGGLEA